MHPSSSPPSFPLDQNGTTSEKNKESEKKEKKKKAHIVVWEGLGTLENAKGICIRKETQM